MMKTPLTPQEVDAFTASVRGEKCNRAIFERATRKIRMGSGIRPEGAFLSREIPRTLKEWRRDQQWSIDLMNRHQAACDAAWLEYWRVMSEIPMEPE